MLEMIAAGGGKTYYAKSGPGPKSLQAGNSDAGYFGTLTQSQLFTSLEIFNQVGLLAYGNDTDPTTLWFKFSYQGKTVYIPSRPINTANQPVSWEDLYQLGVVYGISGVGAYPSPAATPQPQRTMITKKLEGRLAAFLLRLPAATNTDPDTNTNANVSEYGELTALLTKVLAYGVGAGTGKWDSFTADVTTTTFGGLSKTSVSATGMLFAQNVTTTPGFMRYGSTSKTVRSTSVGWWPVLEYHDPSETVLEPVNIVAANPPPMPVDFKIAPGESTTGLFDIINLKATVLGKIVGKAIADPIAPAGKLTVKMLSKTPDARGSVVSPVIPGSIKTVSLLSKRPGPVKYVIDTPLNPYKIKAMYDPAQLSGVTVSNS